MMESNSPAVQTAKTAKNEAQKAANSPWFKWLARLGHVAKGLVYILIGGLAAFAALGQGGETTDRKGAIETIHEQPFGKVLLGLVTIGLFGYALWRFVQATFDTDNKGKDAKGIATRLGYAIIGGSYALLGVAAAQLVLGAGNGGETSDATAKDWTARLLGQPFGTILVIVAGLVVMGIGGYQFYKAFMAKFEEELDLGKMNQQTKKWAVGFGRFGYVARGVVFGLIGLFLIMAAIQHKPDEATGLGGTLQKLAQQTYGPFLLGVVAVGLVAYGVYSLFEARYRRLGNA